MNRRSFLTDIIKLAVASMVLPAALTYGRQWKQIQGGNIYIPNPYWVNADYEFFSSMIINIDAPPRALDIFKWQHEVGVYPPNMGSVTRSIK